eukprot:TRINITY_DN1661_c0_g1_i3.p1 TRINITY_DN1661_c0_g1~~TRINITY_DN1661_c0_g1_i3.p1  ORF type:complete len:162 (-),score=95.05 TRINITY_DN1661_c0_g1_i3:249-734(-)
MYIVVFLFLIFFFFQAEDGIRDLVRSRGLGDVYKRQINRNDTIIIDVATGAIQSTLKARIGAIAMITGGSNRGLVGEILSVERHPGSFDIARLRDKQGNEFATRNNNVFVISNSFDSIPITMPRAQGQRINKIEEREQKLIAAEERKINKGNKKSKKSKKN